MAYRFIVHTPEDSFVHKYGPNGPKKRAPAPAMALDANKKSKAPQLPASAAGASKDAADGRRAHGQVAGPPAANADAERSISHSARSTNPGPTIMSFRIDLPTSACTRGGFAIRGTEISSNAEVVPMLVGQEVFHVCLPYVSRELYADDRIRANYDSMIREIKAVVGGLSPVLDPGFVSIDAGERDLPRKVSEALGRNCVVRVRNYQGEQRLNWDDEMYDSIRHPEAIVSVESQTRRLRPNAPGDPGMLKNMTFKTFVEASSDLAKCYNLRDCFTLEHSAPRFLQKTAESMAFGATVGQNLFGRPGSSMGVPAFREYHELTHSGYYTPARHDGYGQCTYTWLHSGVKLWSWHRLPAHIWRRTDALNGFSALTSPDRVLEGSWYTLRLEPGDVLIQPPNIIHRVYTAERSIVQYGNFFCWHALHLTEMARQVAGPRPAVAEAENLKDIMINQRLAKMALSLNHGYGRATPGRERPPIYNGVSERCLLALFRMVTRRAHEQPGSPGGESDATIPDTTRAASHWQIPLRPEGEDDASGWSDPEEPDPGADLVYEPPGPRPPLPLARRRGEFSDALAAHVVARLHLRLLGAEPDADAYDQPGLPWDDPGPPLPALRSLPIVKILEITDAHLMRAMPPLPEGWDEEDVVPGPDAAHATYTLDGVREHQHVDEIVREIEMKMRAP